LPTQAELDRILFQQSLGNKTTQQIINENLSGGGFTNQDNIAQRMATGAGIAKQAVNKLGNAADVAKLFPGYTGQAKVSIPTGFNFAPKQDPMGGVVPQGLQTQQINVDQLLRAIKPADVLGITGAESAYSDIGAGKAPRPMDVVDTLGLGAGGLAAGKGLLGAGVKTAKYAAPAAGRMLEQYAADTGLLSPLIAYHGTPHTFDKFDISKVGTGEGAQAYGHGIYFAEAPGVARGYQMALGQKAGETTTIGGKPVEVIYEQIQNKANRLPVKEAQIEYDKAAMLEKMMLDTPPDELISYAKDIGADPKVIEWLEKDIAPKTKFPGSFYKVDIPDKSIETFMDWDKPFNKQNESVRRSLNSLHGEVKNKILAKDSGGNDPNGGLIYNRLQEYFSEGKRNDVFSNNANYGAKIASEELNSINIKGIRYKDQGSRITEGGTSNFVVFDPNNISVLERNNKPMK
jgi:hypothetical protein